MEPRVKAQLWVQMALRLGGPGRSTGLWFCAGAMPMRAAILVVLRNRGQRVFASCRKTRAEGGDLAWLRATGGDPVDQEKADAYVARQVRIDPDLWVIEFDSPDPAGRPSRGRSCRSRWRSSAPALSSFDPTYSAAAG